jgi:hypothetical protein
VCEAGSAKLVILTGAPTGTVATSVAAFVSSNLHVAVTVTEASCSVDSPSSNALDDCMGKLKSGKDYSVLWVRIPSTDTNKAAWQVSGKGAYLNIDRLEARSVGDRQADVTLGRIERETMRLFCQMIGLKECPNPMCVMFPHRGEREFDAKGKNLCPPCSAKELPLARSAGLGVLPPQRLRPVSKK